MNGEKLSWYQVASHLKTPVGLLKQQITHREFLDWLEFIRRNEERQTKTDFYLAQIAAEVRRGQVKNPRSVKIKDFLLQSTSGPVPARSAKSKAAWASFLRVDIGKK